MFLEDSLLVQTCQVLLYDKLSIAIFLIIRIPNDPHLQREQQFTNTIIYIERRIKAKHILDLGKRYGDISHITTERQIFIFHYCFLHSLEHEAYNIILRVISMVRAKIEHFPTDL